MLQSRQSDRASIYLDYPVLLKIYVKSSKLFQIWFRIKRRSILNTWTFETISIVRKNFFRQVNCLLQVFSIQTVNG